MAQQNKNAAESENPDWHAAWNWLPAIKGWCSWQVFSAALAAICSFRTVLINLLHHSGNPVCLPGYVALECFHDFDLGMADPGWNFRETSYFTFLPCCVPTLRRLERFMN